MSQEIDFSSCLQKQQCVKIFFSDCDTPQKIYEKIIELGRELPTYPSEYKTAERIVKGCQSTMYLNAQLIDGKIQFQAFSDALISAGLAALLVSIYNKESPETVLTCPPTILEELGIHSSLSPSRANGLASLFQRMKQEALNFLILLQT